LAGYILLEGLKKFHEREVGEKPYSNNTNSPIIKEAKERHTVATSIYYPKADVPTIVAFFFTFICDNNCLGTDESFYE